MLTTSDPGQYPSHIAIIMMSLKLPGFTVLHSDWEPSLARDPLFCTVLFRFLFEFFGDPQRLWVQIQWCFLFITFVFWGFGVLWLGAGCFKWKKKVWETRFLHLLFWLPFSYAAFQDLLPLRWLSILSVSFSASNLLQTILTRSFNRSLPFSFQYLFLLLGPSQTIECCLKISFWRTPKNQAGAEILQPWAAWKKVA